MTQPRAVLDLGTNSTRMLLVDPVAPLEPDSIRAHETIITRLGEGVDEHGEIAPAARERVLEAVRRFQGILEESGGRWMGGIATSACRRASEESVQDLLKAIRRVTGFTPEVISGDREAELTYRGVRFSLSDFESGVVLDIGGGSTEWISSTAPDQFAVESLPVGVVTLYERCVPGDRWTASCDACVTEQLGRWFRPRHPGNGPLVVVGGTGTTLAALALQLDKYDPPRVHGHELTEGEIRDLLESFQGRTFAELAEEPMIQEGREEVLIPGILILLEALSILDLDRTRVSEYGVLAGLLGEDVPA